MTKKDKSEQPSSSETTERAAVAARNPVLWKLDSAADTARRIMETAGAPPLDSWGSVTKNWKRAKRCLIPALDSETGRRVECVAHEPTEAHRVRGWQAALSQGFPGIVAYGLSSPAAVAKYAKVGAEYELATSNALDTAMNRIRDALTAEHVRTGLTAKDLCEHCHGMKPNQRLSRGMAAHFRSVGATSDQASAVASAIVDAAQVKPRIGYCVLSANILDYVTVSEYAVFGSSCLKLSGCYCAGGQTYAADDCSLIAYYYEQDVAHWGITLPKKILRQMVYVDRERRCAVIQPNKGTPVSDSASAMLRRMIAHTIARLVRIPVDDLTWYRTRKEDRVQRVGISAPSTVYIDSSEEIVTLVKGATPSVTIQRHVPCGACGDELDDPACLVCKDCAGRTRCFCAACGCRVDPDDSHSDGDDDYCAGCYAERYSMCEDCEGDFPADDMREVNGRTICRGCFRQSYFTCPECEEGCADDDGQHLDSRGPYCPDCYDALALVCDSCDATYHKEDADEDEEHCPDCQVLYRLRDRLLASPAWQHTTSESLERLRLIYRFQESLAKWPVYYHPTETYLQTLFQGA